MPAIGVHVCEGCGAIYDTIGPYLDCQERHQQERLEACPFCQIIAGTAPATVVREWPNVIAIVPRGPVVPGHVLVIPKTHVSDFAENARITGDTMFRAAELAWDLDQPMNLITSKGREATQSVFHLHAHLVPRAANDGLALPWYSGKHSRKAARSD